MHSSHARDFKSDPAKPVCDVSVHSIHKGQLRSYYEKKLANQGFFSLIEKSSRLAEQFTALEQISSHQFKRRFVVSFYPFDSEPQLNIERAARDEPFRVAYVRIVDWKTGVMEARHARRDIPELWEEYALKSGNRIFQPSAQQPLCKPDEIAAILVPCLAFTKTGQRLGRGVGFYDRFLAIYPEALRIGIAFEDQMAESIPTDSWDQDMDVVLTDFTLHETAKYREFKQTGRIGSRSA